MVNRDGGDKYSSSEYTAKLKGTVPKVKANASQGIPELVQIAKNKRFRENLANKHKKCKVWLVSIWFSICVADV